MNNSHGTETPCVKAYTLVLSLYFTLLPALCHFCLLIPHTVYSVMFFPCTRAIHISWMTGLILIPICQFFFKRVAWWSALYQTPLFFWSGENQVTLLFSTCVRKCVYICLCGRVNKRGTLLKGNQEAGVYIIFLKNNSLLFLIFIFKFNWCGGIDPFSPESKESVLD